MKILLTDGSHMNTLAIMRHLPGHQVDIIHHKKSAPAYSKYCNKLILSPVITNTVAYFEFLYCHVKNNPYDILIPVGALGSYICSKYQDDLKRHVRVEIAAFESFHIAINKSETFKFCEANNILHPKTYPGLEEMRFPCIIKAVSEVKGKFPVEYINDIEEICIQVTSILNKYPHLQRDDLVIQEYIKGEPYGFFCLYQNGVLKRAICQKRIREYPATGGSATSALTINDPRLIELGKNVFDKLHWHGVGMVEYLKKDGEYYLIEINPKFWTSIELHILAGMHFPQYLLTMNRQDFTYNNQYKKKRFVWIFAPECELYRLLQRPGDIFQVIRDLFRSSTDLHLDDLKPTVIQLLYWVHWVFSKLKIKRL